MRHLFTTTAVGLVLAVTPALAQTNQSPTPQDQPEVQQMKPDTDTMQPGAGTESKSPDTGATNVRPPQDNAQSRTSDDANQSVADLDGQRASKLIGASVQNDEGETVGEISDLILARDGSTASALISVGGFLGIGEKDVAVDYTELSVNETENGFTVKIAMSAEALEALPAYKQDASSSDTPAEPEKEQMKDQERAPEGDAAEPKTKL